MARLVRIEDQIEVVMRNRALNLEASSALGNVAHDAFDRTAGWPNDVGAL